MKMQSAVDEYLVEIEVRKYTPKTIRSYRCNLNLFLRFCAEKLHVETVEALTPAVVRQFSRCMSEAGRKGTYINGVLKSIKSFIQYCYEEGYGGFDTRKTFKWCKEEKPVITAFSPEQVRSMLQSCRGHDYLSLRDYAILTLLFETGIRCWELCCIREEDIHNDFIIINGKNHKQRVVPITPVLKKAMLRYESGKEKLRIRMLLSVKLILAGIFAPSFPMRLAVCLVATPWMWMVLPMQVANGTTASMLLLRLIRITLSRFVTMNTSRMILSVCS